MGHKPNLNHQLFNAMSHTFILIPAASAEAAAALMSSEFNDTYEFFTRIAELGCTWEAEATHRSMAAAFTPTQVTWLEGAFKSAYPSAQIVHYNLSTHPDYPEVWMAALEDPLQYIPSEES